MSSSLFDQPLFNERLFFPQPIRTPCPEGAEDLHVAVPGAVLHIRWHHCDRARFTLLLFHGNGEVVGDYDALAPNMAACGASLAVADYRGYGESKGLPTLRATISDAPLVAQALLQRGAAPMVAHGHSLGCVCVAELAKDPPQGLCAIVWDSGFVRLGGLVARRGLEVPREFPQEDLHTFDPLPKLSRCALPTLVLHGARDSVIPPEEAREAWAAIPGATKRLVLLPDCDHNDVFTSPHYWQALAEFLAELPG
jgi:hypothetical protein